MGYTQQEIDKLVFKVQAANVIDANSNTQWYESRLGNSPKIQSDRILSQFDTITDFNNVPTSRYDLVINKIGTSNNPGPLFNIVSNEYIDPATVQPAPAQNLPDIFHQLDIASGGFENTWIAYETTGVRDSGRRLNYINPADVPDGTFGIPSSPGYGVIISYGNGSPTNQLDLSQNLATEVGWAWNYDQGILLLSNATVNFLKGTNGGTMPDLYVSAFRYKGSTGGGNVLVPSYNANVNVCQPISTSTNWPDNNPGINWYFVQAGPTAAKWTPTATNPRIRKKDFMTTESDINITTNITAMSDNNNNIEWVLKIVNPSNPAEFYDISGSIPSLPNPAPAIITIGGSYGSFGPGWTENTVFNIDLDTNFFSNSSFAAQLTEGQLELHIYNNGTQGSIITGCTVQFRYA